MIWFMIVLIVVAVTVGCARVIVNVGSGKTTDAVVNAEIERKKESEKKQEESRTPPASKNP